MYYTVYKITNLINNKIYIGVHKTEDIKDDYKGSGKILKRAQEKYGIENFEKEILKVFDNSEDMYSMESEIVNEDFVKDTETYNLKIGGEGGWDFINSTGINNSGDNATKAGLASKKSRITNPEKFVKNTKAVSERMKKRHKDGLMSYDNFKGKKHSEETKKKISEGVSKKAKGEGNSQFGLIWIYNLEEKLSKKITKEELKTYENQGWIKGRKIKF